MEDVFQYVEGKEAGKRSASRLVDFHAMETASSTYQRKQTDSKDKHDSSHTPTVDRKDMGKLS